MGVGYPEQLIGPGSRTIPPGTLISSQTLSASQEYFNRRIGEYEKKYDQYKAAYGYKMYVDRGSPASDGGAVMTIDADGNMVIRSSSLIEKPSKFSENIRKLFWHRKSQGTLKLPW